MLVYFLTVLALACFALFIGSELLVTVGLTLTALIGCLVLSRRRRFTTLDFIFFLFILYSGTAALLIKCYLLQPLQTNLYAADETSVFLFVGSFSAFLGYAWIRAARPRPFANFFEDIFTRDEFLKFVAPLCFVSGLAFMTAHAFTRYQYEGVALSDGFGGFGTFGFLYTWSAACFVALLGRYPKSNVYKMALVAVAAGAVFIALVTNTKKPIIDVGIVFLLGFLFLNLRVRPSTVAIACIGSWLFLFFIVPAIQIARPNVAGLSFADKMAEYWVTLESHQFDPVLLGEKAEAVHSGYGSFSSSGSYVFPESINIDRFTLILPIDQVVRSLDRVQPLGLEVVTKTVVDALPGFLVQKDGTTTADLIAWRYGFRSTGSIARPVVGLTASSLAGFGAGGAFVLPFIGFMVIGMCLTSVSGRLNGSAWGVALTVSSLHLCEKEIGPIFQYAIREFPIFLATAGLLWLVYGFFGGDQGRNAAPP